MRSNPIYIVALQLLACSSGGDPCPRGFHPERGQDTCVAIAAATDGSDPSLTPPVVDNDSGPAPKLSPELEAGPIGEEASTPDADVMDGATPDAMASTPDASVRDADVGDATNDCSQSDIDKWVPNYGVPVSGSSACFTACGDDVTCATRCIGDLARLDTCYGCTNSQAACVANYCVEACSAPNSTATCMACQCEAHCTHRVLGCYQGWSFSTACPYDLFGPPPRSTDPALTAPLLLREQSATGAYRAARLSADSGQWPASFTHQYSRYFNHLLAFPLGGREYVFHLKSQCHYAPCLTQAAAIMEDGSMSQWLLSINSVEKGGYQENDVFRSNGVTYLTRSEGAGGATGAVLLFRVELNEGKLEVKAEPALSLATSNGGAYDVIEPFQIGSTTYLLGYLRRTGEIRFYRFDNGTVTPVSGALTTLVGVHAMEAFKIGTRWVLFMYTNSGATSTAYLADLVQDGQGVHLGSTPLYQSTTWPRPYTQAVGVSVSATQSYLVLHNPATGETALYTVDSSFTFSTVPRIDQLSTEPAWDVFEVAKQGKW